MSHKLIKSKYGVSPKGWGTNSCTNGSPCNPWKDISSGYQSFLECCRAEIGNGNRVRFWEDSWVNDRVLKALFPRLFALSTKKLLIISHFVDLNSAPVHWDLGFRRNLNDREFNEIIRLLAILEPVRLSSLRSDRRRWQPEKSDIFSCKSFSSHLHSGFSADLLPPYPYIWKVSSPPKVNFFVVAFYWETQYL